MRLRLLALALLAASTVLGAQPSPPTGTRVRLITGAGVTAVGTLVSMDSSAIVTRDDDAHLDTTATASLTCLQVSEGRASRATVGAVVGGLLSGGAFVGMVCGMSSGSCAVNGGNVGGFLGYYAVGAIPGVFIGRAIGGRMRGEESWSEIWRRR